MPMRCLRCGADQSWIEGNRRADENERVEKAGNRARNRRSTRFRSNHCADPRRHRRYGRTEPCCVRVCMLSAR